MKLSGRLDLLVMKLALSLSCMLMGAMAAAASMCFFLARREAKHQTKLVILLSLVLLVGAIDISIIGHKGRGE